MSNPLYNLKCSVCGCKGIHACLGPKPTKTKNLDVSESGSLGKYDTIGEAIDHIRISEAKMRLKRREERKNERRNRGS